MIRCYVQEVWEAPTEVNFDLNFWTNRQRPWLQWRKLELIVSALSFAGFRRHVSISLKDEERKSPNHRSRENSSKDFCQVFGRQKSQGRHVCARTQANIPRRVLSLVRNTWCVIFKASKHPHVSSKPVPTASRSHCFWRRGSSRSSAINSRWIRRSRLEWGWKRFSFYGLNTWAILLQCL